MPQITVNKVALAYDVTGAADAPALLLVMGFGTQMTSWPDGFRQGLVDAGFRVVRFDNRDAGLSQKFSGIPAPRDVLAAVAEGRAPGIPYTLDDMADDAAALLDALGIASAHVLGASMGGMIAQLLALRHPGKVRSLVSVMSTTGDPTLPRADADVQAALVSKPPAEDLESVVAHGLAVRRLLTGTTLAADSAELRPLLAANFSRAYYPEGTARQWAAILAAAPRTERLKRLSLPALVLHGADDRLVKPAAGRHTAECIPGARYVEIPGWGHDMAEAAIPHVLGAVVPFLAQVEAERADAMARPAAPGCCGAGGGLQ